jgi:hypothetical protein
MSAGCLAASSPPQPDPGGGFAVLIGRRAGMGSRVLRRVSRGIPIFGRRREGRDPVVVLRFRLDTKGRKGPGARFGLDQSERAFFRRRFHSGNRQEWVGFREGWRTPSPYIRECRSSRGNPRRHPTSHASSPRKEALDAAQAPRGHRFSCRRMTAILKLLNRRAARLGKLTKWSARR